MDSNVLLRHVVLRDRLITLSNAFPDIVAVPSEDVGESSRDHLGMIREFIRGRNAFGVVSRLVANLAYATKNENVRPGLSFSHYC